MRAESLKQPRVAEKGDRHLSGRARVCEAHDVYPHFLLGSSRVAPKNCTGPLPRSLKKLGIDIISAEQLKQPRKMSVPNFFSLPSCPRFLRAALVSSPKKLGIDIISAGPLKQPRKMSVPNFFSLPCHRIAEKGDRHLSGRAKVCEAHDVYPHFLLGSSRVAPKNCTGPLPRSLKKLGIDIISAEQLKQPRKMSVPNFFSLPSSWAASASTLRLAAFNSSASR